MRILILLKCFVLLCSLVCKIRIRTTEPFTPVSVTVEVHEGKAEGRYSIDGKAEMSGFTFVVMNAGAAVIYWWRQTR